MNVYKSLSPVSVIKPYMLPITRREVYSFEGLCLYLVEDWFETVMALEDGLLIKFISQQLDMGQMVDRMEMLSLSESMNVMLDMLPFEVIVGANYFKGLSDWDAMSAYERFKFKGDSYYQNCQYMMALSTYQQARLESETAEVVNNIGLTQLMLKDYKGAASAFNEAIRIAPKYEIYHNLIQVYRQQGRLDDAMNLIFSIIETYDSPLLLIEAGEINLQKHRYNEALMNYSKAYEIAPSDEVLYRMIEIRIEARQLKTAMAQLEQLRDKDVKRYFKLAADIYEKAKHFDVAIETLEEGLEVCGDDLDFNMKLVRLYRENNQIIKAIEVVNRISAVLGSNNKLVYEMAMIAKKAGRYEDYYDKLDQLISVWKEEARYRLTF